MTDANEQALVPIQPLLFRWFSWIARRRIRKGFNALRIAHLDRFPQTSGPLIVYLNHPSWWDPLVAMALAPHLIGRRSFYAPIEAESLRRYGIFRRLGLFPVEIDSARGAAQFLRTAEAVLRQGHVLGITPQGRFTDVREQPPELKAGLGALLARLQRAGQTVSVVPLALEYPFWNERAPEALACIGQPLIIGARAAPQTAAEWTACLQGALGAAQDELRALAIARNPEPLHVLLAGRSGVRGFYGVWQRFTRFSHKR